MKKYFSLLALMLYASVSFGQLRIGGRSIDIQKATGAASELVTAAILTDADVVKLSREAVEWMDANDPVLPDDEPTYGARLKRLTENLTYSKV